MSPELFVDHRLAAVVAVQAQVCLASTGQPRKLVRGVAPPGLKSDRKRSWLVGGFEGSEELGGHTAAGADFQAL